MWLVGSERLDIFLGTSMLGVCPPGKPARWFDVSNAFESWDRAQQEIDSVVDERKTIVRAKVWLSGSLARPFMLPAMPGITRVHDALKVAQAMCAEATGLAGPCRVWLDDWTRELECLAVAVEQSVVDAVEAGAGQGKFTLESLRPWWSDALGASLALAERPSLLAIDDGEALTILGGRKGCFTTAVGYGHANPEQIESIVSRAMLVGAAENGKAVLVHRRDFDEAVASKRNKLEVSFDADWEHMK